MSGTLGGFFLTHTV